MKNLFLLIITFVLIQFNAKAITGSPDEIFRPLSKQHLQKLNDRGIISIQSMNIKNLLTEMEEVNWRTFNKGFLAGSGGKRTTSVYLVKDKMVVINLLALQNLVGKPIPITTWALHEALGALGHNDENYELSSSIAFIAINPQLETETSIALVKNQFKEFNKNKQDKVYAMAGNGGATVIGGGGDAPLIEFKQLLLKNLYENRPELSLANKKALFDYILKLPIDYDMQEGATYDDFQINFKNNTLVFGIGYLLKIDDLINQNLINKVLDLIVEK